MKTRFCLLAAVMCLSNISSAQKHYKYWSSARQYTFRALYLDSAGNTISDDSIRLHPTEKIWSADSNQTLMDFILGFSAEDSARLAPYPVSGERELWARHYREGVIENTSRIWMHPIRQNQYMLTEVAPFPEVSFPLKKGNRWTKKLWIMDGWGIFQGEVNSIYTCDSIETRDYPFGRFPCWKISASATHSTLGKSELILYFNEEIGFTEMHYSFYNRQRMAFTLTNFTETK